MPITELTIATPADFRFAENLAYLGRSPNECMHRIENGGISRLIRTEGGSGSGGGYVEVRKGTEGSLLVRTTASPGAAEAYVREWFDLDADLAPFYRLAEADPLLAPVAIRYRGLRLIGIPDLFEALCWGILGQQINLAFAYALKRRLVESFGGSEERDGTTHYLFPEPETIAGLEPAALTSLQITGRKAEYLIGTARLIADGTLTRQGLLDLEDCAEAERALVGIRGIGPWTAHYVLMRCLRYRDALPLQDVGLHNAIRTLLGMDRKPTLNEIREMAKGWAGWEAYAVFYLWRALY